MDAVIKNRIDMIKRGEVPKKYKKTKVGIIPEVWEVKKLGKIVSKVLDGTHSTPKYTNKGVQFYSVENVTNNDFVNTKYISEQEHNRISKRCPVEKGDILMTRIGSIGDVRIINWDVKASIYVSLALLKFNCKTVRDYFYSYAKSQNFKKAILRNSLLNAIPQKINLGDIEKVNIIIPKNTSEQQKIAQILSAWDNAIELKNNLLEMKEEQKKGLMQNLLTGKVRISGFSSEWKEVKLCEVSQLKNGYAFKSKSYYKNGKYKIITISNVTGNKYINGSDCNHINELPSDIQEHQIIKDNDILISLTGNVGRVSYNIGKNNLLNQRVGLLEITSNTIFKEFLFQILNNKRFEKEMNNIAQGAAQLNIGKYDVENYKISIPILKEQRAIANILSTSDKESELIKEEIEMLKEQKKGLMQLLLTGIVRVEV